MNKQALIRWLVPLMAAVFVGVVWAKLPPPTEEQKAKAEEAKAKAAEAAKNDAELLTKAQDRVVERYIEEQKAKGVVVKPTPIAPTAGAAAKAPISAAEAEVRPKDETQQKAKRVVVKATPIALIAGAAAKAPVSAVQAEVRPKDEARWTTPDTTPQQRYNTALKEATAAYQQALEDCKALKGRERADCIKEAKAGHDQDLAEAKKQLAQ